MDNLQDNSKRDESSSARRVQVKSAPGIYLTPEQVALLNQAFPKEEIILVKQEFRSGYSGAVVVLVSVGVGRAPLVVKLAHPHDLQKEYEAYEEYVRQVSPQNIAHLQGKPLVAPDGQLGLLQYTFAGGESHLPTTSMQEYFESAGAEATSAVLNRIFRVYGRHWWANNRAQTYVLDEYYDRMLPVHLQASRTDAASQAEHVIQSGESGILAVEKIAIGQVVELAGYQVIKVRDGGRRLTLMGQSPASEASAPLRVRVELDKPAAYHPGDTVESMVVTVTATRQSLLGAAAHAALPSFDPQAKQFTLSSGSTGGDVVLPNPLLKLPQQLYQVVETKTSIIHGDLNLQNVLVDGPTGFAWLIDFAETRVGPTLLDLQRLEVQAITKLLPAGGDIPLAAVVEMMTRLHADPPLPAPPQPQLREPYALLATIRRLARQYLIDDLDWNEYYYGLVVVLLGALKYDELDSASRRLALVCAAAAESLIGQPLQQVSAIAGDMAEQDEPNPPAPVRAMAPTPRPETPSPVADTPPRATPALPLTQKPARPVQQRAAAPAVVAVPSAPAKKARNTAGLVIALVALLLIGAGGWWISTLSSSSGPSTAAELASGAVVEAAAVDATDAPSSEPTSATPSSDLTAGADLAGAAALAETPGDADAQTVQTPSATTEAGQADRSTAEELVAPTAAPSTPATEAAQALPTATQLQPSSTTAVADAVEAKAALTLLSSINMRSGPGSDYPIVGTLRIGTVVEPVGRGGNSSDVWYQIEDPEKQGQLVWVSGNAQLVDASGVANVPQVTPVAGVTPIAAATQPPALSARSGQIYFSAPSASGNDNIYSVPATGDGAPILVVSNARQPAHVANGTRLAFKSTVDSALGISGYDEATQNRVVYSGSPEDAVPSWNPGGDQIVFGSNRAGDRNWRLYVTWPNSGGTVAERGKGADPDWHPSQDLVVFKSCDDSGGRCGLWTMAADGSSRRPLTNNPSDSRPRWTPDGSSVVFMSAERDGNWELYQVQAAGGDVRRLTDNPANDGLPAVSPDGEYVAFLSNRDGAWGIWSVPLAGGDPELVAALNTPMPDWLSQGLSWSR